MRFVIEMNLPEAIAARAYLNADEGLRNQAAERLLRVNKPLQQEAMAAVVNGLAALSRGLNLEDLEGLNLVIAASETTASERARASRVEAGLRGML